MADQRASPATEGSNATENAAVENAPVTITTNNFYEIARHFDGHGNLIDKATKIAILCEICHTERLALCNFDVDKGLGATNEPYVVLPRCGHAFGSLCFAEWYRTGGTTCPSCRRAIDFEGTNKTIFVVYGSVDDREAQRQEVEQVVCILSMALPRRAYKYGQMTGPDRWRDNDISYAGPADANAEAQIRVHVREEVEEGEGEEVDEEENEDDEYDEEGEEGEGEAISPLSSSPRMMLDASPPTRRPLYGIIALLSPEEEQAVARQVAASGGMSDWWAAYNRDVNIDGDGESGGEDQYEGGEGEEEDDEDDEDDEE